MVVDYNAFANGTGMNGILTVAEQVCSFNCACVLCPCRAVPCRAVSSWVVWCRAVSNRVWWWRAVCCRVGIVCCRVWCRVSCVREEHITQQIPGAVIYADLTPFLIDAGYWASYNIPFYPTIYNVSG